MKKALRQQAKDWVFSLAKGEKSQLDELVSQQIQKLLIQKKPLIMGAYTPMKDEVVWDVACKLPEKTLVSYPVMTQEKSLEYWLFKNGQKTQQVTPELILVPGLMFTRNGDRLGRGGGYFDRFLPNFDGLTIGVNYAARTIDQWETEEHDMNVQGLVTEAGFDIF